LPANKNKHFEQSYFEVPFQRFIDFFGAVSVYNSDFDLKEPKNFNGYYKRGVLRFERENYEGALSDFREAIKQKPDNDFWILYAIMGSTQHKMKNYNAAIRSFEKAIILKPKDDMQMKAWSRNYYNRGLSFLMLNKKMDACKDFQQAKLLGISDKEALKVIKKNCRGKYKPN